ncbi:MAG: MarR family transcriptional regulator [Oligoflexia bacterium]|nr:MarR family transcriptional regulator [Oligoflexia bacterium]
MKKGAANQGHHFDPYAKLYDLFLSFNRRLLKILSELKSPLNTNESHLLQEVYAGLGVARDLSQTLSLQKSTISRVLSSLSQQGLLIVAGARDDRRVKTLKLSTAGLDLLLQDIAIRNREVDLCVEPLVQDERERLLKILHALANGLGAPVFHAQAEVNPLLVEIRRLTRAMGFIGPNCMGTGMSVAECQILHLLHQDHSELSMQEIAVKLSFAEPSEFSRLIKEMVRRGLVIKTAAKADRRRQILRLGARGRQTAQVNIERAAKWLQEGLKNVLADERRELIKLVEKFVNAPLAFAISALPEGVEIRVLETAEELKAGRVFLIESYFRSNLAHQAPEVLAGSSNLCVGAWIDRQIKALLEIQRGSRGKYVMHNLLVAKDVAQSSVPRHLLHAALRALEGEGGVEFLEFPERIDRGLLGLDGGAENRPLKVSELAKLVQISK